jgi:hypothetical protein
MLATNRVIWNDNGTLKDLSNKLNNFFSESQVLDFIAAQDKIYIGSDVPFNHRFINLSVVNDVAASVTVEIWDGNSWVAAVDVQDGTALAGVPLAQDGILRWATDQDKTWGQEQSTEDMAASGLQTLKIYNMYWVRLSWSVDLKATMSLAYFGHKFSKDEDLGGYYPDLNRANVKTAFQSGKTTWLEQHILAAEELFRDIRNQRALWSKNQIFEPEVFTMPAVHKVAQIVYTAFGSEYESRRDEAYDRYKEALEGALSQGIDKDEDGHVEEDEHAGMTVGLFRR